MRKAQGVAKPTAQSKYLDVSQRQVIIIMQRTPGELVTVNAFLKALKKPADVFDNGAAVIWAVTRAEEAGRCESGWLGTGPAAVRGWKVKPPPDSVDGVKKV